MSKWGFNCWQPILCYGKDPYLENCLGSRSDVIEDNVPADKFWRTKHPCPKPVTFWKKLLQRVTADKKVSVLDPFMGSGTTGLICKEKGLDFIGIEIEPSYYETAERRINQAQEELFSCK